VVVVVVEAEVGVEVEVVVVVGVEAVVVVVVEFGVGVEAVVKVEFGVGVKIEMKEKLCTIKKKITPDDIGKDALFPMYNSDVDFLKKCKDGSELLTNTEKRRNPRHHKLVFAMAKCTIANAPEDSIISRMQPYDMIKEIMFVNGIVDMKFRLDGQQYYTPKSIKFESMDETEFDKVSDLISEQCAKILQIEVVEFRRNYMDYL